jgi:hypothetical protein
LSGPRTRTVGGRRRLRDWHPLAGDDPVPGDPDAILDEAAHLRQVAAMLRAEANDLRLIAQGHGLKGAYADALRDGARELEVHLRETAGRYERVHGELAGWAHELADLQTEADRVVRAAQAEVASSFGDTDSSGGADCGDDPVAAYRASLAKITARRDERAAYYASRIHGRIDDTVKDSWWERCKDAVDDYQSAISLAVDVMSWVATGIAIAALTMTPAGWVAGLALWLTFGVLAGHLLLASAGDGSWADIAMDLFGLLTMQVGATALRSLRGVRDATKLAAELVAEERAAETSARATQALRDRTSAVVNRRVSSRAARAMARHNRNIARAAARRAGRAAAAQEAATPMASASRWEAAAVGGDRETANLHKDVLRLRARYPESEGVLRASEGAERRYYALRAAFGSATAVDLGDKFAGDSDLFPMKPVSGAYGGMKDRYAREVGSRW